MAHQTCFHQGCTCKVEQGKGISRGSNLYCSDHCANAESSGRKRASANSQVVSELVRSMAASAAMLCSSSTIAQDRPARDLKEEISHGLSKTTQSSQEKHQEGDQSRQAKTNPETPPEENPPSSRKASRESQTITKVASASAPQSTGFTEFTVNICGRRTLRAPQST
jgi:Prokaryotic metallothionein